MSEADPPPPKDRADEATSDGSSRLDLDSAGVYFMSVEEFESRSSESPAREKPLEPAD